jgi:putative membrane protein
MTYASFKVLHLSAIAIWIVGMLWQTWGLESARASSDARKLDGVLRYDRLAALPAMGLTWAFGLYLAVRGGWLGAHWLWLKLAFVVSLTAAYLIQRHAIRLAASAGALPTGRVWRLAGAWMLVAAASAITLALKKPF